MPGPSKKPTKLKKLEGNAGKRSLPEKEPAPSIEIKSPICPAYLKGPARQEWNRIVPELHRLGLLTVIDQAAIEVYCSYFQQWKEAEAELARMRREFRDALKRRKKDPRSKEKLPSNGLVATTSNGNSIMEPMLSVKKQAAEMMHKFLIEFGMTPASRTRTAGVVDSRKSKSPMEKLLEGTRDILN